LIFGVLGKYARLGISVQTELYCLSLLVDLFPGVEPNEEPNFIKSEIEQFKTYRDKDGDGFLDIGEVWKNTFYFS